MKLKKKSPFSDKNQRDSTRFNAKKWSKIIQNVRITSILTTFILLMIKDRKLQESGNKQNKIKEN